MTLTDPEDLLQSARRAIEAGDDGQSLLDEFPVPIYMTDADGAVTRWNRACIDFAGREPVGDEKWCVSWQLFTMDGRPMAHEECPMARAVREKRSIRGELAIARRPDGSRVAFRPYPTPILDESGNVLFAINLMVDISEEQSGALRTQADRCRRLAGATHDRNAADMLSQMANGYDQTAAALRGKQD